jgi:hypothetical protein
MNLRTLAGCMFIVGMIAGNAAVLADETTGIVADTGFGSFTLDEKGTMRKFNLSSSSSQYEPGGWRPTPGDELNVTFTVVPGKNGGAVLAVGKVTLVKAGPSTVAVTSPIVVEVVEVGKSGVNAKVPTGQIVKFNYQRSTQKIPVGWMPVIGNKAKLDVHFEKGFGGFKVNYLIDKMEKVD